MPKEYLGVREIAEELDVDVQTVRRWIHQGQLRAYQPVQKFRVRREDLDEFMETRVVRPKELTKGEPR